ncbi:MAG: UTP--glucose-phosphate uridylyltransferase GalU [Actinomycetota bacterium]|jgi:UTP--glucose-1-phosphate uridylyltransferase
METPWVTKAVIPVGGMGTRFLPATKAMPKEMLPLVDRPVIQFVVEEAVEAGLTDVLFVTGRNKNALENHFDRSTEVENLLESRGDAKQLNEVMKATSLANIHYVRQGDVLGLGHAVLKSRQHVGHEPFVVLLGDDVMELEDHLLRDMLDAYREYNATIIALIEVEADQTHLYGCAEVETTSDAQLVRIKNLVEKPQPGTAPSNLAIIGRYVLKPEIFDILENTTPGAGGEIQLTDALKVLAHDETIAGPVFGFIYQGKRYDTGDKLGYIQASVEMALKRPDLGPALRTWLKQFGGG